MWNPTPPTYPNHSLQQQYSPKLLLSPKMVPYVLEYQEDWFYDHYWTKEVDQLFIQALVHEAVKGNFGVGSSNVHALLMAQGVVKDTYGTVITLTMSRK